MGYLTSPTGWAVVFAVTTLFVLVQSRRSKSRWSSLPPGPPVTNWLLGHLSILPATKPWKVYTEWGHQYGPIMHLRAATQRMIVLSSLEDCNELLERRSNLYSDRPTYTMTELMGWDFNTGVLPYGPRWRRQRRLFDQMFSRKMASLSYRPEQSRKINDMLYGLLTSPGDFRDHVKTMSAAIVMSTAYGYNVKPKGDHFVKIAEEAIERLSLAVVPGAALVNAMPIMKHLPSWFPGAGFQKVASDTKIWTTQMKEEPFKHAKKNMEAGTTANCIVSELLPSCKTNEDVVDLQDDTNQALLPLLAGADTTTVSMKSFFYAMAVTPEVQKKAQQEIDRVVGRERLPTFQDWESLPYTEAVMREILRWKPVLPLGVPHRLTEDDMYKGYLIPKGALILTNVWAITRDEGRYKDAEMFNPDRFLDEHSKLNDDECDFTFGFGRRICPGRHMARATLWLSMATTLWAFNIGKAKDASGNEIPISGEYSDGMIR
ncbi:hypothetical protein D9619_007174 [Psilocybe cf. subviscida]|uniref:Cytochrome P450 n=1 Tax=Psilocybe cf. subviscida TaxID=2480587 RepID=A0A8H5EWR6_9AGAR|nr:hypothetical protein D9619_007174 [Psilocybe cf. subviscida]